MLKHNNLYKILGKKVTGNPKIYSNDDIIITMLDYHRPIVRVKIINETEETNKILQRLQKHSDNTDGIVNVKYSYEKIILKPPEC